MSFDAESLLASLLVSSVGFVLAVYGRRMSRLPHGVTGVALLIFPYFVSSALLTLLIAAVILGALWLAVRWGW